MKGLPLILTFALLGVNTPFSAAPKEVKPVTVVEDAAAWDALFSPESLTNVTYTTHTVIEEEDYEAGSVTRRDGNHLEYRYSSDDGYALFEDYLPCAKMILSYSVTDGEGSCSYFPVTEKSWNAESCFCLEEQYAGRFDEAVYDEENSCYHLTGDDASASVYAENGRLVKIIDSMKVGGAVFHTDAVFTDYGTTVIAPIPEIAAAVTADEWEAAFSGEGLKNHVIDVTGKNTAGKFHSYLVLGSNTATLNYYGASTEENPDGLRVDYGYKSIEGGVASFCYQDYHWELSSLDSEIMWEDAILEFTGLGGLAGAFDSAVFDEVSGCYLLTLNRLGEDETYTVFFADGELSYIRMESESVTSSTVFSSFTDNYDEEDWIPASAYASVG